MSKPNEYDTYIIPPNFIEGGTFFGGLLKLRNTAEALVIVLAIGIPVFSVSALTLTAKIIILCLTALPLGIIALVGINGESLSSFIFLVLKYLHNRRVITLNEEEQGKRKKRKKRKAKGGDAAPKYINPVAEYLPVEKIENGVIYTRDHRYLKIVEVVPINFLLRSAREQRNIIYSFISFLKISPVKMQIKVIAKRADLNRHREIVQQEMARETDENCRLLQQDYLTLIDRIGAREATTRRFFMVFEYEAWAGRKRDNEEAEAIASLQTAARTAVNYLKQCGNEVLIPENDDEFTVDTLYHLLCRNTTTSLPDRVRRIVAQYQEKGLESEIDAIPCTEFFAPDSIDFTNGRHICIDGLYYAYLLVPSTGYKAQVPAGWLSLIVNAGDGIDLDMFISRQPKARMVQRLGQQLRINRSKIKDASDTNTDFDDLDGAIRSGYFLKEGLGNNEDFYYLNLLIAVTAPTVDELEWKVNELKKLLVSRDMDVCSCAFHEEQAFLSSLPLVSMEKHLFERSKRNALTTGVASCYPFTSYELSDENGILFGLNKYNNSPVIIDIFNSKVYKNANIQAVDVQQQRVQSGNSAGSTVCINDGDIVHHGDQHGNEGVEAADLNGNRIAQGTTHGRSHIHQSVVGVDGVGRKVNVLQCNGRTHACGHSGIGVDIHLTSGDHAELRITMFLDVVLQHLQTGAGRTTTAGTQDGGTIDDVDNILT